MQVLSQSVINYLLGTREAKNGTEYINYDYIMALGSSTCSHLSLNIFLESNRTKLSVHRNDFHDDKISLVWVQRTQ